VVSLFLLCTMTSFAQSLGDIARQERERKKDEPRRETHVYTNDDLEKPHILVPEDQARALAARTNASAPAVAASVSPVPGSPVVTAALPPAAAQQQPTPISSSASPSVPVQMPEMNLPVDRPQPLQSARTVINQAPRTALVSSPTGWKVVYAEPPNPKRSAPDLATHDATPKPLPVLGRPAVNSSGAIGVQVEHGDSLWKLAKRYLGSGARWRELSALNPELSNPNVLRVGDTIHLRPERPWNTKQFVVRSGDTLWSLARAEFGTSSAVTCIATANPQLHSPDLIRPGETLVLPETCILAR